VLSGRRPATPDAQRVVHDLERQGATVHCVAADAADPAAMSAVLQRIRSEGPPLRGVVHAAGALHDAVLLRQQWIEAREAMRGKAHGAWLLHELTREDPLDFFVLYSAAGNLLGASGQGLYAAANAQLDALAQVRARLGLPALSIAWGAWAGAGMAGAAGAQGRDPWEARGLGKLTAETAFPSMARLLDEHATQAAVMVIDWERFLAQLPPGADREFFAGVTRAAAGAGPASGAAATDIAQRVRALPAGQRRQALVTHLSSQVLHVLGLDPQTPVDPRTPLKDVGLDSLMAVELRNALNRSAPRPLPATLVFDYPTLEALAGHLAKVWDLGCEPAAPVPGASAAAAPALRTDVAGLSDEDAEAQLLAELNALNAGRAS
jgi:hypothetical protein